MSATILTIGPGSTIGPGVTLTVPVAHLSLSFDGVSNQHVQITNNAYDDWVLNDVYTIEWWEKVADASNNTFYSILCQRAGDDCIDIFHNNGYINGFNAALQFTQPAFGSWNHIVIQKDGTTSTVYINGVGHVPQGVTHNTLSRADLNLIIGSRTADGGGYFYGQYYKGKLTNIRISGVARYSGTFTPPLTLDIDADVVLALDGSLVDKSLNPHTITNYGAVVDTDFPT
jgi:hypothetical protein